MTYVYRILTDSEWRVSQRRGTLCPNTLDLKSGFMHLSGEDEVLETAARYFPPDTQPVALRILAEALSPMLRWEPVASRDGVAFPHLYADEVALTLVEAALPLHPRAGGGFTWGGQTKGDI
jgi:uncharacterized protein (DUF952 family)